MNKRHEKFKQTMIGIGARCLNECPGPDTAPNTSRLEFWGVPGKGVCVAQLWNDGGVTTFVDWPTGSTWEDLKSLLTATTEASAIDGQSPAKMALRDALKASLEFMLTKVRRPGDWCFQWIVEPFEPCNCAICKARGALGKEVV